MYRTEKQTPWYHKPLPQCGTEIIRGKKAYQCVFSARYEDTEGRNIFLCKIHADMVEFPVKPITETRRIIRED